MPTETESGQRRLSASALCKDFVRICLEGAVLGQNRQAMCGASHGACPTIGGITL